MVPSTLPPLHVDESLLAFHVSTYKIAPNIMSGHHLLEKNLIYHFSFIIFVNFAPDTVRVLIGLFLPVPNLLSTSNVYFIWHMQIHFECCNTYKQRKYLIRPKSIISNSSSIFFLKSFNISLSLLVPADKVIHINANDQDFTIFTLRGKQCLFTVTPGREAGESRAEVSIYPVEPSPQALF